MLPYEQKSWIFYTNSVSTGTMCSVKSYNQCLKCSLLASTQAHNRFCLLPCQWHAVQTQLRSPLFRVCPSFFETECTNQTQKKTRQCPVISCLVMRHNDQLAQRCHTALHYSAEKPTISWLWIQRSTTMPPQSSTFTRTVQILLTLNLSSFLSRVSTLMRDIDIRILSVCLSVRNVPVLDENGLTYCHSFFTVQYNPIILVLSASNIFTKFRQGHPLWGCKIQVGYEKFLNFLPISRYTSQTIQDSVIVTMEDE